VVKRYGDVQLVHVNEARLCQVFVNLLVNAAQAFGDSRASNEIQITTYGPSAGLVAIEIEDTGPGIPIEVQRKLFTPFFTTKAVGAGTGLGLAICQRIVRSFAGEISMESEVGRGTRFTVTLPAALTAAEQAIVTSVHEPVSAASIGGRVLVVDDEPMVGKLIQRSLGRVHAVTYVGGAAEALGLISGGATFDVIFCDLTMPGMTGIDLCRELEASAPAMAERLVFITGGACTPEAADFLERSHHRQVEKPFSTSALNEIVVSMIALGH
jgi:CheY-like chemotaxis protein/anti-sigma regulatory factor (Ser/Thr protein kinase)